MQSSSEGNIDSLYNEAYEKRWDCSFCCDICHKAFPHSEDFKQGSGNHKELAQTFDGQCLICHRNYKDNMPTMGETGCLTCHDGKKIEIHWIDAAGKTAGLKKEFKRLPSSHSTLHPTVHSKKQ